jgi:hypothetical protein
MRSSFLMQLEALCPASYWPVRVTVDSSEDNLKCRDRQPKAAGLCSVQVRSA